MLSLVESGGPLVWVLMILSVYGLALVIERLLYFRRCATQPEDLTCGLRNLVRRGAFIEAIHEASRAPSPLARLAEVALEGHELPETELKARVKEETRVQVVGLERNIRGLLAVGIVAPMIGSLASLNSLIRGFRMGETIATEQFLEIMNACLVPASLGLAVAIPATLFFLLLSSLARRNAQELEGGGKEIVRLVLQLRDSPKEENDS